MADEEFSGKLCPTCGQRKTIDQFPRNKRKKDGLDRQCKECTNARIRAAYAKDPAKKIAKTRQYHLDHPEWSKRVQREWHQRNKDRRYAEYLERGKDPDVAARRREATRRCEHRRRASVAGDLSAKTISSEEYERILVEYAECCWICDVSLCDVDMHWDHVRPLAKGGRHVVENLRPACASCNIKKNDSWPLTSALLDEIRAASEAGRKPKVSD